MKTWFLILSTWAMLVSRPSAASYYPPLPEYPDKPFWVKQTSGRYLVLRDEQKKSTTIHLSAVLTGSAPQAGWLIPLPAVPKVSTGSDMVFRLLEKATRPHFELTQTGMNENCRPPAMGCKNPDPTLPFQDGVVFWDGSGGSGEVATGNPPPAVSAVASGQAGPFDYQIITAKSATALLQWLADNGYSQPEGSTALLQAYLDAGNVFVAIRLQSGSGLQDIVPLVLEVPALVGSIPLRLAAFNAATDANLQVFLVGPGRGMAKNMLQVEPNPLWFSWDKLTWQAGGWWPDNYNVALSAAMDTAGGAAVVIEYAQPVAEATYPPSEKTNYFKQLTATTDLQGLTNWITWSRSLTSDAAVAVALATATDLPEQLSATAAQLVAFLPYCHDDYWKVTYGQPDGANGPGGVAMCLQQHLGILPAKLASLQVNPTALVSYVEEHWWQPLEVVQAQLQAAGQTQSWLTRLHVGIDPAKTDRDLHFGFHSSLPQVVRTWQTNRSTVCTDGWDPVDNDRWSFVGLGSWVGALADVALSTGAPAARWTELVDEQGPSAIVAPDQVTQTAAAIATAAPGSPQLPPGFVLLPATPWQPLPSDPTLTAAGPWPQPYWCEPKNGWESGKAPPDVEIPDPPDGETPDGMSDDIFVIDAVSTSDASQPDNTDTLADGLAADAGETPPKQQAKSDGCSASSVPVGSAWPLLLVLGLWVGWRRDRSRVSLALVSSKH